MKWQVEGRISRPVDKLRLQRFALEAVSDNPVGFVFPMAESLMLAAEHRMEYGRFFFYYIDEAAKKPQNT